MCFGKRVLLQELDFVIVGRVRKVKIWKGEFRRLEKLVSSQFEKVSIFNCLIRIIKEDFMESFMESCFFYGD